MLMERSTLKSPETPPRRRFSGYSWRVALKHPATVLGLVLLALFAYLIIAPVASLLLSSIQVAFGDEMATGQQAGSWTTHYFERVFADAVSPIIFYRPLLNTLMVAGMSIMGALIIGLPAAWLISRTDLLGRRWFSTALLVPYMLPAWTFALAWTTLFKNREVGGGIGWLESLGVTPPNWLAYGMLPITVIFTLHFIPYVILLVTGAMKNLPDEYDDAAQLLGANRTQRMLKITLPLLRPAILSAATLIFAKAIGEFGVAYVLGTPADFQVLSTTLYQSIQTQQAGTAAVISVVMVALGAISLWIDVKFLKEMRRYTTISGKGHSSRPQPLGSLRIPAFIAVAGLFTISVVIPLGVLLLSTIMQVPGQFQFSNFTLNYWLGSDLPFANFREGVLVNPETWSAVWNTIWMVGLAAVCSGVLGMLIGYVVVRSPARWIGTVLRVTAFTPYLVPGIAFAVAYLSLFAVQRGPIPALYGTAVILVLILIADEMPFASRAGISAMMQLGKDPEEASQVLGARWWTRMRRIVFPIHRSALASAILLPFISGVQSLSLVIVLATPGTHLLTTLSMNLVDSGYTHAANAITLLICVVALVGTWLARRLFKADLAQGAGGS